MSCNLTLPRQNRPEIERRSRGVLPGANAQDYKTRQLNYHTISYYSPIVELNPRSPEND